MASLYFENLLCAPHLPVAEELNPIFPNTITEASATAALLPITDDDIQAALFSIPDTKAPGPDGYNALFFKKSWDVIKYDFIAAIKYFFSNNSLPRCVNATRVALVPKQEQLVCLNDFRPISCCNVLYKCIAKLLVIRLKAALVDVIGPSQSAFIPGRNISDAILLTQELMHNYHHNNGPGRCALKIDLKKAFDTVSLEFILAGLHAIGIPHEMVNWIKICITTVHYTININGALHGFFKSTRGIRQGDPLSPYLFVLAMEGLNGILQQSVNSSNFKYHWRCQQNKITHLCFVDDLMMFCHADLESIIVLKSSLDRFSKLSSLTINHAKSSLFMAGVDDSLRSNIKDNIGIHEAALPMRYLGVPLISSRLTHTACIPLVERITSRIKLWTSSSLTYVGRLQLIKSVLFSIQVYWSSMFILPCATIRKIESILAAFLWKGNDSSTFLWYDYWLPERTRFIDVYPLRTLTATGLPWNAQVSTIIQDGQWHFPRDVPAIQPTLNSIHFYPNPTSKDTYTWIGHPSGKFSIASAWELLRARRPINNMHHLLWFAGHIPRHSFILWLACLGRLRTMDRLSAAGIIQNASCILCGLQTETHEHLFFNCTTSRQVWQTVNAVATIYWPSCNWSDLLQWGAVNYNKKNDVQHLIACLLLTTTVYHLWQERNKRVFSNQYQSASTLAEEVFQQVRLQLTTMKFSGRIPQKICNIWGLMDSPPA
ncbi:hypothetical protein NC653_024183 [Populus alba x Populus x berolinensis]|uniref:Reverse transcriptase domain-containing protein n=1 Tax=Populus alba x Populus x berolinensis TaxID=444605 RepID=A0AAD6Q6F5_9ROSI|nr:hypothetical protein NC653_024183 [Populus alba x Populus x berolinensis]